MSGHSKWHSIRHKKAAVDAKRGKVFTKIIKEISVAARINGGDVDSNPRLRTAVAAAKEQNMPQDNIKRAILKGTGDLPGQSYEETTYEGYGPGGVAIYLEVLTDNKNRTVAEIRHLFAKYNGNLGETGSVAWMFDKKGYFSTSTENVTEEDLFEVVAEAGAEDIQQEGDSFLVYCDVDVFEDVKQALEEAAISVEQAEITMVPQNQVKVEGKQAFQTLTLMEMLEDHDDVQNVYANFDIDDADLEAYSSS